MQFGTQCMQRMRTSERRGHVVLALAHAWIQLECLCLGRTSPRWTWRLTASKVELATLATRSKCASMGSWVTSSCMLVQELESLL